METTEQSHEETPNSPKTPKLSEEVCEMTLTEENEDEENVCKVEVETVTASTIDTSACVLKEIIQKCPAGQTNEISPLCKELFPNLCDFIDQEIEKKLLKDSFISKSTGILITEDNECEASAETMSNENEEEEDDEFKRELSKKLEGYVKELYSENGSFLIHKASTDTYKVHILGEKLRPKTFWSGHWHSTWSVNFKEDDQKGLSFSISGLVDLNVHYHEDGSVELAAKKEIQSRVDMKYENLLQAAEKVYWKIRDSEDSVQVALNEAYKHLSESIFKRLRRQLPVTRTKMDWAKFSDYNLSNELKK